tara:strand:+ start:7014 stop:8054 length:1041 start_codon:yes stop_codon:yes gene_type:complete
MACGLGAVALMFIFVKEATFSPLTESFKDEIIPLEDQIITIDNIIESKEIELSNVETSIKDINFEVSEVESRTEIANNVIDNLVDQNTNLNSSLEELNKKSETKYKPVKKSYISGCNIEGKKIILLLDSSESMLHKELVQIIRLSVQNDSVKQNTEKWSKAKQIFRWMVTNLPEGSQVMLATFNKDLRIYPNNKWIDSSNKVEIEKNILYLLNQSPDHGTNLQLAFSKLSSFSSADNIYLITDGLPTLAIKPRSLKENIKSRSVSQELSLKERRIASCLDEPLVDLQCRLNYFNAFKDTYKKSFRSSKLNTILLPMKGDPLASYEYALFSKETNGCFLTSSKDWPL